MNNMPVEAHCQELADQKILVFVDERHACSVAFKYIVSL